MKGNWYEIRDGKNDVVEVLLYDEIGPWGVSAQEFVKELQAINAFATINLRVNSPGGDVFSGIAIYNALKNHGATVNATVDGLAASIASLITQAGDTVLMATGATMMVHEPNGMTMGDAEAHSKMVETLDKMGGTIASIYAARAGGTEAEWRGRMQEESWYRAQEAVDIKLADGLVEIAENRNPPGIFNLSKFKHVPEWMSARGDHTASDHTLTAPGGEPPEPEEQDDNLDLGAIIQENAKLAPVSPSLESLLAKHPVRDTIAKAVEGG